MTTVTSSEFQKDYGKLVDTALIEPVIIKKHNRPQLVLLSFREYHALEEMKTHFEDMVLKMRMDEAKKGEYIGKKDILDALDNITR